MGLVFEMPILLWLLGSLGIINKKMLRSWRRYAIVVLLILAAAITPTGDPFTLMIVFLPLYLLYELSIVFVKNG
jgi:sec-independent protein translocase protein TatC